MRSLLLVARLSSRPQLGRSCGIDAEFRGGPEFWRLKAAKAETSAC